MLQGDGCTSSTATIRPRGGPDTPLTYSDVQIVRLSKGATYDVTERPLDQVYERSVEAGSLLANPYRPE